MCKSVAAWKAKIVVFKGGEKECLEQEEGCCVKPGEHHKKKDTELRIRENEGSNKRRVVRTQYMISE